MVRNGLWGWLRRLGTLGGLALTAIGSISLPEQIEAWAKLFDRAHYHPRAIALAEYAVTAAQFLNLWYVRVLLVSIGFLMLIWPLRWFWRLRHKWLFNWRRLVSEQVWISRDDAITLVRESAWGRLKSPTITRRVRTPSSLYSGILSGFGGKEYDEQVSGLSETEKSLIKFDAYLSQTIDQFISDNPSAIKLSQNGEAQIDETKLRAFLKKAMEREVRDEFGDVPSFKV